LANDGRLVWGVVIASLELALAVLVVVFNAINVHKFRIFCMISYIAMGWACIMVVHMIVHALSLPGFLFLLGGGLAYTSGLLFYRAKIKFNHAIWHFFVLAGSALHFVSIYCYVLR
jgi:hemolysin III